MTTVAQNTETQLSRKVSPSPLPNPPASLLVHVAGEPMSLGVALKPLDKFRPLDALQ